MKKRLFPAYVMIIFLLIFTSCSQSDCKTFKTGKYILKDDEKGLEYIIERNDSIQVETDVNTGITSKYKVRWLDECKYELSIIEGREELLNYYKNRTLIIEIEETFDDAYKFSARLSDSEQKNYQVLRKIL